MCLLVLHPNHGVLHSGKNIQPTSRQWCSHIQTVKRGAVAPKHKTARLHASARGLSGGDREDEGGGGHIQANACRKSSRLGDGETVHSTQTKTLPGGRGRRQPCPGPCVRGAEGHSRRHFSCSTNTQLGQVPAEVSTTWACPPRNPPVQWSQLAKPCRAGAAPTDADVDEAPEGRGPLHRLSHVARQRDAAAGRQAVMALLEAGARRTSVEAWLGAFHASVWAASDDAVHAELAAGLAGSADMGIVNLEQDQK